MLKGRLLHWWNGTAPPLPGIKKEAPTLEPGSNRYGKPLWSADRLQVVEKMFKNITPMPISQLHSMLAPLGLNPAMYMLELGAGIGLNMRYAYESFGVRVLGYEESPFLVKEGNSRIPTLLHSKLELKTFDRNKFLCLQRRMDVIFANWLFYTISDKDALFTSIFKCLKPGGQLLFIDCVVNEPSPELDHWQLSEEHKPHPLSIDKTTELISRYGLTLVRMEELSEPWFALLTKYFWDFSMFLKDVSVDKSTRGNITQEIELWAAREYAIRHGLKIVLFYAVKRRSLDELID